jgi:ketosteroid isomerase-like protein
MKIDYCLFFIVLFYSCNSNKAYDFDLATVKAHIVLMNKSYSERFMRNDTVYYNERYCKDAEVYAPQMQMVKGIDSIRNFFYQNGTNKEAKIELPVGNIYGNAELVVEEGIYNFPDGKGGSLDKGKFIAIWKQENGKWKLYREIWNSDIAPTK